MRFAKLLLSILAWACISVLHAQVDLTPKFHQFGNVRPGEKYRLKIKITNKTPYRIALSRLHSNCDCTSVKIPENLLKPNSSEWMMLTYEPPISERGWKSLDVHFNAKSFGDKGKAVPEREVIFNFTANLEPKFYQDPGSIDMGFISTGKSTTGHGELYLDPKIYSHWKPGRIEVDNAAFPSKITALPTPGHYAVEILAPENLEPGHYQGSVKVHGVDPKDEIFTFPFKIVIGSLWNIVPASLNPGSTWDDLKNWKPQTHVDLNSHKPFKVLKVENAPLWLKYEISEVSGASYFIKWRVDEGLFKRAENKQFPKALRVETDQKIESSFPIKIEPANGSK